MPLIIRHPSGSVRFSIPGNPYLLSWSRNPQVVCTLTLKASDNTEYKFAPNATGNFELGLIKDSNYTYEITGTSPMGTRLPHIISGNIKVSGNSLPTSEVTVTPVAAVSLPAEKAAAELAKLDNDIEVSKRELELAEIRRKIMMLQTSSVEPSAEGGKDEQKSKVDRSSTTNVTYNIHDSAIGGDIETKIKDKDE